MKRLIRNNADPRAFRASAAQLRRLAASMADDEARARVLAVAAEYEAIALAGGASSDESPRCKLTISLH